MTLTKVADYSVTFNAMQIKEALREYAKMHGIEIPDYASFTGAMHLVTLRWPENPS